MPTPTAVILAAGLGSRLLGVQGDLPKGLLPALGKTFVSRAIDILRQEGVAEVVIVTGHGAEQYDALAARYPTGVRTVFNSAFATEGTMRSLATALDQVQGAVVVLDADIVYEARALREILREPAENAIVLTEIGTLGDEFLAWTDDGGTRLLHLSKDPATRDLAADGEHIGIIKLGADMAGALGHWARNDPKAAGSLPYEHCLLPLLADHPMAAVRVADLVWTEVDTPAMLNHAQTVTLPRLAALEG
jgi:choline kinase